MSTRQITCSRCGAVFSADNRFCIHCGAALTPPVPASSEAQTGEWHLIVTDGPDAGRRYSLGQRMHLGRSAEVALCLNDPQASRKHALIQHTQGKLVITDSGSRNGTFVNGRRIAQPTTLANGDLIRIGNTTLQVSRQPAAARNAHPPAAPPPAAPSPPPAPPLPQAPPSEVVGIIPAVEHKKGLFGRQTFNLVVTLHHLVFARLTSEMLRAASKQAKEKAKVQGKGFFGQWVATVRGNSALTQRYYQMPVEAILREHPDNFAIPLQEIRQIKTKHYSDPEYPQPDQLIIQARDKIKLNLKSCSAGEAKKTLRQVLGSRVK